MIQKEESRKHHQLVKELMGKFKQEYDYRVEAADGITNDQPDVVENKNGIGDGKNKRPDINAYDESEKRIVRGEAKVGNGDVESLHSVTQYRLFSNKEKEGVSSWLYVIVPKKEKKSLNNVIVEKVPKKYWDNIKMIASEEYQN